MHVALDGAAFLSAYLPHRFRPERVLARRETSETLLAHDLGFWDRPAVVKVTRVATAVGRRAVQAEIQDVQSRWARISKLRHPLVSTPYTFGVVEPPDEECLLLYEARRYVPGLTLAELPRPLDSLACVRLAVLLARALISTHRQGLVHGDLKPENVAVRMAASAEVDRHSRAVLFDFSSRVDSMSARGLGEVSLQYLAPELARGGPATPLSDLYALGVTLYLLASAELPFDRKSVSAILAAQRSREFTPLSQTRASTPREFNQLVESLLEPHPANRPNSAHEVANALLATGLETIDLDVASREDLSELWIDRSTDVREAVGVIDSRPANQKSGGVIIHAPTAGGVTTVLRDIQDHVESGGCTALSLLPSRVLGISMWEQIARPLSAILRVGETLGYGAGTDAAMTRSAPTAASVLDDIHGCLLKRNVVLFVDQADSCDAAEAHFLHRALMHNQLPSLRQMRGRLSVVLGRRTRDVGPLQGPLAQLAGFTFEGLLLAPVTAAQLDESLERLGFSRKASLEHCEQLVAATHGVIGPLIELVGEFFRGLSRGESPGTAVAKAIHDHRSSARPASAAAMDRYSRTPEGRAALTLALWGARVSQDEWTALCETVGASTDPLEESWSVAGTQLIRHTHDGVSSGVGDLVDATRESAQQGDALGLVPLLTSLVRRRAKSMDSDDVRSVLRFLSRIGYVPRELKWAALRANLLLNRRGFDTQHYLPANSHVGTDGAASDGYLLNLVWKPESTCEPKSSCGRPSLVSDVSRETVHARRHAETWALARSHLRLGRTSEALEFYDRLISSCAAPLMACRSALLEEAGHTALGLGRTKLATAYSEKIRAFVMERPRSGTLLRVLRPKSGESRRGAESGTALAACRYWRLRGRISYERERHRRARACAARELGLAETFGLSDRVASARSNLAVLELRGGRTARAVALLKACASTCAMLDDDEGLCAALVNLAASYSRAGQASKAIATLNRVRLVATRAGLKRRVEAATMNLGSHYARIGRLRAAHRCFSSIVRSDRDHPQSLADSGAGRVLLRALHNAGTAALELSHVQIARAHLDQLCALAEKHSGDYAKRLAVRLKLRVAERTNGVEGALTMAQSMGSAAHVLQAEMELLKEVLWWETGGARGQRMPARDRRSLSQGLRLELLCARAAHCRIERSASVAARLMRMSEALGGTRSLLGLFCTLLQRSLEEGCAEALVDEVIATLGAPWLREGHEDLHARVRTLAACSLRRVGREREADALLREAARLFELFERRWRRGGGCPATVEREWHEIERWLKSAAGGALRRAGPLSTRMAAMVLKSADFGVGGRVGSPRSPGTSAAEGVYAVLASMDSFDDVVKKEIQLLAESVGAQRAIFLRRASDGFESVAECIRGSGDVVNQPTGPLQISWGLISGVWSDGRPRVFGDALSSDELAGHRSVDSFALRSVACVPVALGSERIGVLYLDHRGVAGLFGPEEVVAIQLVAAVIALADKCSEARGAQEKTANVLRECEAQLVRAERNRLAGEVLSGKAHDLKNILASIVARSQLARQYREPERVCRALKQVDSAAQEAAKLIQQMQECSVDHELRPMESVSLLDVAEQIVRLIAPESHGDETAMPGKIQYHVSGDRGVTVRAVPGELREMMLNLCVNARDAMPSGGSLTVIVDRDDSTGSAILEVADTGVGMPPEICQRVFEPFFTTKGSGGTGLGLAIVRRVAIKYGGEVKVESEADRGTVFRIRLPLNSELRADLARSRADF